MSCIEPLPSQMEYELTDATTDTAADHRTARDSEVFIQTVKTDIQKAVDQLSHMTSFDDSREFAPFRCAQPVDPP